MFLFLFKSFFSNKSLTLIYLESFIYSGLLYLENGIVYDYLPADVDVSKFLLLRIGENNILGFYFESILWIDLSRD